jgi:hypothetical protein
VRRLGAERSANGEGSVGDLVDLAGGPLLLLFVDEEQANLQGGVRVGLGVGNLSVGAECDGVYLWGGSGAESGSRDRAVKGISVAVMLLEAPCFLHDKLLTRYNTSREAAEIGGRTEENSAGG